jgi:predicted nucleotidyltransferase
MAHLSHIGDNGEVDFTHPLEAIVPGAVGRVLTVLVNTSAPLSGRTIAELAGVSSSQAARVLPSLVDLGLVTAESAPPAILYSLVTDHIAAAPLQALTASAQTFVDRLAEHVARLEPAPVSVAAFGSFARHQADAASDIDLLVVRPSAIAADDESWETTVDQIRTFARRLSGNGIDILEAPRDEAAALMASDAPLWHDIRRDALLIHGRPLTEI